MAIMQKWHEKDVHNGLMAVDPKAIMISRAIIA
jgi:hypothetical protein